MPRYSKFGLLDSQIADAGDVGFLRVNNRIRPDQIKEAEVSESVNGRMDLDGAWQVRRGIDTFGPTLTANTASIRLLASPTWALYDGTVNVSSATRSTTTVTVTTASNHGYLDQTIVCLAGLTGSVDPNGNRLITVTGLNTFTFVIAGAGGSESYGGTGTVVPAKLSATSVTGVFGSCGFSNPATANDNYVLLATNLEVVAIKLLDGSSSAIAYPSGVTITSEVEMLQAFDKVFIFREGAQALQWNGSFAGTPAFTAVPGGIYTQPVYLSDAGNTVISNGVVTVNHAAGHGLAVGDSVFVVQSASTGLVDGDEYTVATVPTSTSFTVFAQVPNYAAHLTVWSARQSEGKGFIHMPGPAWGVQHQRRLWVPYAYEPATGPAYTARNVLDELIASDILDSDTYDKLQAQYRISGGTADSLVGAEPFADDNLLVFMRHSIHLIKGISGSLADTFVNLITREVGCVARRSIKQVGNQVLFLSDNGVYAAAFGDLYNLRGAGLPLSEPIKGTISRINADYAQNAVSAYFDNRYFLAVPLDGSVTNNALLVYNFLNQGWESVDTVNDAGWEIKNLIVGDVGGLSRLYVVGSSGAVHIVDARVAGGDRLTLYAGIAASAYPIVSLMRTRQYTFGTMDRKKFSSYEVHLESSDSEDSDAGIGIETENPDAVDALATVNSLLGGRLAVGEDASLRGRIGNKRGYGIQVTFTPTNGRPKVRAVRVQAALTDPTITQSS